jgi:hypothetical protein
LYNLNIDPTLSKPHMATIRFAIWGFKFKDRQHIIFEIEQQIFGEAS